MTEQNVLVSDPATETAAWQAWLRRRKSAGTAEKWGAHIAVFLEWCAETGLADLADITPGLVDDGYLSWWHARFERRHGRRPADKTQVGVHDALASLFRWLERNDRGPARNPMARVERPVVHRKRIDALDAAELDRLLAGASSPQQRIAVWLLRWTGLRCGEATGLDQRDVDLVRGFIYVRASKTNAGVRDVPLLPELRPELERWLAYLTARGLSGPHFPLLVTRTGKRMADQQLWRAVKLAAAHAGVRPHRDPSAHGRANVADVSPHTLRRSFATDLLNRGLDVASLSRVLGHSSVIVTQTAYAELRWATVAERVLAVA